MDRFLDGEDAFIDVMVVDPGVGDIGCRKPLGPWLLLQKALLDIIMLKIDNESDEKVIGQDIDIQSQYHLFVRICQYCRFNFFFIVLA